LAAHGSGGFGGGFAAHIGAAQALLAQLGEGAVDAADPLLERARGVAALVDNLVEPACELQDRIGNPPRRVFGRTDRTGMIFRQQCELMPQVIQPFVDPGQVLAAILGRSGFVGTEPDAFIGGLL